MSKKDIHSRSFEQFKRDCGTNAIVKIATEYAYGDDTVTINYLASKHQLSKYAVQQLLANAIVECLVSFQTALVMKAKAHRGQVRHSSERLTSSDKYYDKLLIERLTFVKNFDKSRIIPVVDAYLKNSSKSAIEIAKSFNLSVEELNLILKKAIIFNYVDDSAFQQLWTLALKKAKHPNETSKILEYYQLLRQRYLELSSRIVQMNFQLESYEDFISSDEELEFHKNELEKELRIFEEEFDNIKNLL